jgi:microcin C transport system substrate-binding protein
LEADVRARLVQQVFGFGVALLLFPALLSEPLFATEPPRLHALSLVGVPQMAPDFKHFPWVDPEAPKGGVVRSRAIGTFDSLNRYAVKGNPAVGLSLIHATLMTPSLDEPSTDYGLVAAWVAHPADFSSATFGLRPEAAFHDGRPITPEDVVFTLEAIKAANPRYALYYKNVVRAEKTGAAEVTFYFDAPGNRELPQIVGGLPVLARHFWTGRTDRGEPRDLSRGTLEIPLGSGPYRIASVDAPQRLVYQRVADWWGKDLAVVRGQWNFDEIRYTYYRDRTPAFEGFRVGDTDFWPESSAKGWATQYDFDAVKRGLVKRELIETQEIASMQGFAFNTRRKQFQDPRVRRAFNLAFNYEWANQAMFFSQYRRVGSYFENSELACRGLPEGRELEILNEVRDGLPPELFTKPYKNPINANPDDFRRHMAEASRLLTEAGWKPKNGVLTNAAGEVLTAEFLLFQPDFERLVLAYKGDLEKLGMRISVRTVDSAHYRQRIGSFDFDIVVANFPQSMSPGNEQREFWSSTSADRENTRNIIGIKNPAIDRLIERLIYAKDRADLVAATRALDRALLWGHYVVPQFYAPADRIAYWDRFGRPTKLPGHASAQAAFLQVWWHDAAAAKRLEAARRP